LVPPPYVNYKSSAPFLEIVAVKVKFSARRLFFLSKTAGQPI